MKSSYPVVPLKGYVHQVSVRNKSESHVEVYSVTNSEGFTKSTDYFSKEVFSKDISKYKVVGAGQFAYNPSRINVGSVDYLRCVNRALVSPLYIVFETSDEIYPDYLLRYLKSNWGNAQIRANTEGAVRDSLKFKGLESIKIPLPSIDDQKRIANLLSKVEGLIAQRKQHLQQLDDLLKSVFLEMFGPHALGYADWPLVQIKDLAANHRGAMRTGPFGSNLLHSEFTTEGDVAVLGIDNAVQNHFAWDGRRFITHEKYKELESYRIFPGDVIVTIMGTIGRSAVVPNDIPLAINTKHLAAITLNRELANPLFLSYSIHSSPFILNQFRSKNRGAIMSGLNLGLIKETKLKRPPIELQNTFAETHTRVDKVKAMYQQSLTDLEKLYGALSQKAFKGELDLSRVPLIEPITGTLNAQLEDGTMTATGTASAVNLPDMEDLPDALLTDEGRQRILQHWLAAYVTQLKGAAFSVSNFLDTAQVRMAELHPDSDFEIGLTEYDQLKDWVFAAVKAGRLFQTFDNENKHMKLVPPPSQWGSW